MANASGEPREMNLILCVLTLRESVEEIPDHGKDPHLRGVAAHPPA